MEIFKSNWNPPEDWLKIESVETHTEGEPPRIITGGIPLIAGDTIRRYFVNNFDHLNLV